MSRCLARRALLVALAATALALPAAAQADYEQMPEHFGVGGEAEQLRNATAMAINVNGAGGVEAGSIYVVGRNARVVRYGPGQEGEAPPFREAWGWGVGDGAGEYQRCGPALATEPAQHSFHTCTPAPSQAGVGGEETGNFQNLAGVAVDQVTGNLYVLNNPRAGSREHHLIEVFTATGMPVGTGFGDAGGISTTTPRESIAEGPEKLHSQGVTTRGIAVDEAGIVYVSDADFTNIANPPGESRVMSFEPQSPGDYEHYVYAGRSKDITSVRSQELTKIALVGGGELVGASSEAIRSYPVSGGSTPTCAYQVPEGQLQGMTANPVTGEVFYASFANRRVHRLGPCNPATEEFKELQQGILTAPETPTMRALAVNPVLSWGSSRPSGALYGADPELHGAQTGIGDVFAPAKVFPPQVKTESVTSTGTGSTTLRAEIDPHGFTTGYIFQYLSEAEYEANEPDERQSLAVKATGGLFGLGFEGAKLGREATADLASGSTLATNLRTAAGTADLHAAKGTATLSGAVGTGTVISGSSKVTAAVAGEGAFAAGQAIQGQGIPAGTTIAAVSGSELTLSAQATQSVANTPLKAGTPTLTSLSTAEGVFEAGQQIEGEGIPTGTTIKAAGPTELTLSNPITKPGAAVAIAAGSTTLDGLLVGEGAFQAGTPIKGEGIPAGTTITTVHPGSLTISKAPTKPGSAVAISSSGPAPLAVGETLAGPGVAPGTKIVAAEAGKLTLSQPAQATVPGAHLSAGLPFDAGAGEVESALEGLSTIGAGNVSVSGGPGDETGSSPYEVEFGGALENRDLPEIEADATGLSGGPATANVTTLHGGGGGFAAGALEAPAGGGQLGGGGIGVATASISGLQPNIAYRFRVVASSECEGPGEPLCETSGPAASFRTYPTPMAGLPDNRAYELVSPAQKNGGEVFPADPRTSSCGKQGGCKPPGEGLGAVFPMQSAPNGDAVAYMGFPFSPEEGAAVFNSYLSRRTAAGWQTTALSPLLQATKDLGTLAVDDGLGQGLISQGVPQLAPQAPSGYRDLYLQNTADPGALSPLLTAAPPNRNEQGFTLGYVGHSADFSRQFFAANDALTAASPFAPVAPDPGSAGHNLYEWHEGELALVNVLPGNATIGTGASFASASPDAHSVSDDGSRLFWKTASVLYVREEGERTIKVHDPGKFLIASPEGSKVLLSDGCLYSLDAESCIDLTEGAGGFLGLAGSARDLSRVYFVDSKALPATAGEENGHGEEATNGADNLYVWDESGPTRFIATLIDQDNQALAGDWNPNAARRTAQASADGEWLAFASEAPLTGYDNFGPTCQLSFNGEPVPARCTETFLYRAATGHLTCVSCNPTGETPIGPSILRLIAEAPEWLPQPRYLSSSGRLYFDSSDRLSPLDTNGRTEDVYEFEPQGTGNCTRPEGCVTLISPGTGNVDSNFLAMDQTGANVFFTTRERLVAKDTDELIDLYDAREGGGFASETETQPAECQGEACQAPVSAPDDPTPGSSSFEGAGNVREKPSPARCRKPKVRRKGHCVKPQKSKRRHPRANRDRGGAK